MFYELTLSILNSLTPTTPAWGVVTGLGLAAFVCGVIWVCTPDNSPKHDRRLYALRDIALTIGELVRLQQKSVEVEFHPTARVTGNTTLNWANEMQRMGGGIGGGRHELFGSPGVGGRPLEPLVENLPTPEKIKELQEQMAKYKPNKRKATTRRKPR